MAVSVDNITQIARHTYSVHFTGTGYLITFECELLPRSPIVFAEDLRDDRCVLLS